MSTIQLDGIDRKILSILIENARTPYLEVARACGVTGAAIHQRIAKLEDAGIITGSRLLVKPAALGLKVCAFINVDLSEANKLEVVIEGLKHIPEIVECHFVTGASSLLVKVFCQDYDELMDILMNKIQTIPNVRATNTMISLNEVFERQVYVNKK